MKPYDVLIVGAGPAGSRVAAKLASAGYNVAVLEKQLSVADRVCCTGIIGRECADLFDIDRALVLQEARSAKLFAPSGEFLSISKDETQAYIVDRQAFDRSMAARAEKLGVTFLFGKQVIDIAVSKDGVTLFVNDRGKTETLDGKVAVIASGYSSKLPQKLGLGRIDHAMFGAQIETESISIDEVEVHFSQKLAPHFFAWLVPVSANRSRVGLLTKERPGKYLGEFVRLLASQGKLASDAMPDISYGAIPLKPLPRTYGERVLAVGDAAGQVKPTTGGGIYYGLLCADIAADTIDHAFAANNFSKRRMASYEKRWREKLGRELRIDYYARRLYNRLSDKRINDIFEIARDNNIHESLLGSSHMSFDWHGELVLEGLKQFKPWRQLLGKYLPQYILRSLRGTRS